MHISGAIIAGAMIAGAWSFPVLAIGIVAAYWFLADDEEEPAPDSAVSQYL